MKKAIILAIAFIASFTASVEIYSSTKDLKPSNKVCRYDIDKGECSKTVDGAACYLVNEDCSWMD